MHETDAFRKECRTEVIAKWWLPHTAYYAQYTRDGLFCVFEEGSPVGTGVLGGDLHDAAVWCYHNGYVRLSDWKKQP